MKIYAKKKTALVLGGGAARGLAHLGILKVLRREKMQFDFVLGASIGALFAAVWALEADLAETEKTSLKTSAKDILDVALSRMGLCKGEKLEYLIKETLQGGTFEDAKIPLYITTTDIENGECVLHSSGDLAKVVKASCAMPGAFRPVEIGGRLMADGGITGNVPVRFAKELGATHVVAADVGYCVRKGGVNNMLNVIIQAIQIMGQRLNKFETRQADFVLRPELDQIDQTEFSRAEEIIGRGEAIAERHVKRIRRIADKGRLSKGIGFLWE